jgi:peptidyl-tRNA hydrolase, PTH2 family
MSRGKIAVQCSHAAVSAAEEARLRFRHWYNIWVEEGQAKIALKVTGLGPLLNLQKKAQDIPIPSYMVRDRGLTQVPTGSITCLGIGPAPVNTVDTLTGKLRLL